MTAWTNRTFGGAKVARMLRDEQTIEDGMEALGRAMRKEIKKQEKIASRAAPLTAPLCGAKLAGPPAGRAKRRDGQSALPPAAVKKKRYAKTKKAVSHG